MLDEQYLRIIPSSLDCSPQADGQQLVKNLQVLQGKEGGSNATPHCNCSGIDGLKSLVLCDQVSQPAG